MDQTEYVALLARAGHARTIAELRALVTEIRAVHHDDVDAGRVEEVCRMYAIDMIAALPESRTRRLVERSAVIDYTERAYR